MYNPYDLVGEMNVAEVATIRIDRTCKDEIWDECAKNAKELFPTFLSDGKTTIDLMGYKASTAQGRTSGVLRLARRHVFEDNF